MATEYNIIQFEKFYESRSTSFSLVLRFNKQWKKYSLHLTRNYSYTQDGVTKQG